jgi:hypothetical protein
MEKNILEDRIREKEDKFKIKEEREKKKINQTKEISRFIRKKTRKIKTIRRKMVRAFFRTCYLTFSSGYVQHGREHGEWKKGNITNS